MTNLIHPKDMYSTISYTKEELEEAVGDFVDVDEFLQAVKKQIEERDNENDTLERIALGDTVIVRTVSPDGTVMDKNSFEKFAKEKGLEVSWRELDGSWKVKAP